MLKKANEHLKVRCLIGDKEDGHTKTIEQLPVLMWSHYADSHKGFCIRYEFPEDMFQGYEINVIYKLKDVSIDAMRMLKIFEDIFKEDRNIKESFTRPDEITRERVLRIAPLLHDMKSYLDKLKASLSAEEEPELLKAVNYALTEYPCMLRCLEDGSLDLSNNICERQIRIAKYRNNSFFVGSPAAGVRFARLMSVFANIRNHKLDPVKYLCDVFRRIKNTANDKLVELLAHKW